MTQQQAPVIAVIGGTGMNQWSGFEEVESITADTPWGAPSAALRIGRFAATPVIFLARHGHGHHIPPHRINARANMQALADAGIRRVIAVAAVGSMTERLPPGHIALPGDCIDYTWGRGHTYSDDASSALQHIEFTQPFSPLREELQHIAGASSLAVVDGGLLAVTQGPRLETAAEVRRLMHDGCDMVGMTTMPEAALARELGMQYAVVAVCVNWAAGLGRGDIHGEIEASVAAGMQRVHDLFSDALPRLS